MRIMIFVVPYMDNKNVASLSLEELFVGLCGFHRKKLISACILYAAPTNGCFSVAVAAGI